MIRVWLQGDRGYEGPKGSRGPTGVGYKGDKVWLNMVGITDTCIVKTCVVWPLTYLNTRETQEPLGCRVWWGFQGQASKEKR